MLSQGSYNHGCAHTSCSCNVSADEHLQLHCTAQCFWDCLTLLIINSLQTALTHLSGCSQICSEKSAVGMLGGCPTQAANCQSDCSYQAPVVTEQAWSPGLPKMQVKCLTVMTAQEAALVAMRRLQHCPSWMARSLHTSQRQHGELVAMVHEVCLSFSTGRLHCLVAMMQLTILLSMHVLLDSQNITCSC